MAYEISSSIAAGTVVTQNVTGASHAQNRRSGGRFSPDGTKLAVPVMKAPGSPADKGKIEIYQSGSSGWVVTEEFLTNNAADPAENTEPSMLEWISDTQIVLGLRTTSPGLHTFVSSSDHGWYDSTNNPSIRRTTIFDGRHSFIFNPSKTLVAIYKPFQGNTGENFFDVHKCTGGAQWSGTRITPAADEEGNQVALASLAWLSDTDIAVGQPSHDAFGNADTNHGQIEIFRTTDGGSSFSSIDSVVGQNGDKIGAALYYHTASGNLIVGTGIPEGDAFDNSGGNKWYLYQSSSTGGYLQGVTDRTELTSTGLWSGRVPLNYNMQADDSAPRFAIQTLPTAPNSANAEVLIWESGSEGWKASVIDNNVSYKNVGAGTHPLVGLSKLGYVANNNNVSPTDNATDKSFRVHIPANAGAGFSGPPAGFTLSQSATPLNITEGTTGTVGVVLDKQPSSDVVISVSLAGSLSGRASLSSATLTFTNANWNTQQNITVTATANNVDDDNATGNITFSVVDASSDDDFDPLDDKTIALTVVDNNTAGFTLTTSASPFNITEGSTGTISVVLDSQPDSGNVVIDIDGTALSGRATLDKTSLTFTTANWNSAQVVTVTAVSDIIDNDNATGNITFSVNDGSTDDAKFDALPDQPVAVTIVDNDTAGLLIVDRASRTTTMRVLNDETGCAMVRLQTQPLSDVVIDASLSQNIGNRGTISPSTLKFTPSDWRKTQLVCVTNVSGSDDRFGLRGTVVFKINDGLTADTKYKAVADTSLNLILEELPQNPISPISAAEYYATIGARSGVGFSPFHDMSTTFKEETPFQLESRKVYFEPSTIETIDMSVLKYLKDLNLFADTNEGWREVPVIWGTAERSFQTKNNKDIRDQQGLLKMPIITIRRNSVTKDMASKGAFVGNVPENSDEQGGSLIISRVVNQEKTKNFANNDAQRLFGQENYPFHNKKVVYKTISAPMPVNVTLNYEITIRTEYQQQMNNLMLPFITKPGTINYVTLSEQGHRYEGFIDGNFSNQDNLQNFSSEERKFETRISLRVVGYLVGQNNNREKPHFSIRENVVEVKIPRERLVTDPGEWDRH